MRNTRHYSSDQIKDVEMGRAEVRRVRTLVAKHEGTRPLGKLHEW
jgi:hypothetical protein